MNDVIATMLAQMGGIGPIAVMTGAQIVYDNDANFATLIFRKQQGAKKISHLKVTYEVGLDLYKLEGYRYNKRTLKCPMVYDLNMVYGEDLKRICEDLTGLYFSLR